MVDENLPAERFKSFEELRKINQYGAEYWSARDLQPLLGYNQWRSFENAVKKAIISCEQSGNKPDYHFARARKMIIGDNSGQLTQLNDTIKNRNQIDEVIETHGGWPL